MSLNISALQRNEQCYCGTSKKYKVCCLRKDEEFYTTYRDKDVLIFHDMAITDGKMTDEQFNDGRVSLTDDQDINVAQEAHDYIAEGESCDAEKGAQHVEKVRVLIDKNPNDPALYNLLYNLYLMLDQDAHAQATIDAITTKFPYYFFGKANRAKDCFYNSDFDGIFSAFNESYTLHQLYPHREVFHVSEARNFHFLMALYTLATMDTERTRFQSRTFRKLNELCGYDKEPDTLVTEFDRFFDTFFASMLRSIYEPLHEEMES